MELLIKPEITAEDEKTLATLLAHPVLRKYLQLLAVNVAEDMITALNDPGIDPEAYLRAQFKGKGQLSAIYDLLQTQQLAASTTNQG